MSAATITLLNFVIHSLVIGAVAWLLVRFIIRDAMRRCILANLAVLMSLYSPFDISMRDLFPPQKPVPVWTPLRETFEADWRVTVAPATKPVVLPAASVHAWNMNDTVEKLRWLALLVTAALLLRLLIQSIRLQRWAWRLRYPSSAEYEKLPAGVNPERIRVFDHDITPCAAGWFYPVIAVPATAFEKLTPRQWHWIIRHESEHLRCHDTVAVLLQNIVRASLWWNPFIHALIEEYARAREEACDAAAVGKDHDQSDYADFLLAWAAKASPQSSCMMPIAHSRPARRLKARLVALMEARGVRKKLGALFVLGCAAFAVITPFFAASFGIATAMAQPAKPSDKAHTMITRIYRLAPDFLADAETAQAMLVKQGIVFPEGASAIFQRATSSLIVRHHQAALDQIEAIIDRQHQRLPQVYFQCKLIQADKHFGTHEGILKREEEEALLRQISQRKGIDLLSSPSVTVKIGHQAAVSVLTRVESEGQVPKVGTNLAFSPGMPSKGRLPLDVSVELAADSEAPQKIHTHTSLRSGEAFVLHMRKSGKPVTVLIIAEALNPQGQKAISFESTATMQPSSTGVDMPDKAVSEWAVRAYKLPKSFPQDKTPVEVLKASGIAFPKGADASLKDGKLTVRNTKANLELIEVWLDALIQGEVKKSVYLSVKAVEMKGDHVKQLHDWLLPSAEKVDAIQTPATTEAPPLAMRQQFTMTGVLTDPQLQVIFRNIAKSRINVERLGAKQANGKPVLFKLPAAMGGREIKIEPVIGPDGYTIDLTIRTPSQDQNPATGISTAVIIWDGQTVVLGSQPSEGVSRFLFITGSLIEKSGE